MKRFYLALTVLSLLFSLSSNAQTPISVNGVVISSEDKEPVIGATVSVKGTARGTITSMTGEFSIQVNVGDVLEFSYIGMKSEEVTVQSTSSKLNVVLNPDAQTLNEVVVVAYGTRKKGTVAGSVGSVKSSSIENVPTPSFDQALQGQVAGLSVTSNSGDPSAAAKFTIRGTNSINSGTSPLFILDGAPISEVDFNTINPNDIDNISVLKDASSTSIYGARAANGVVIITTKRGKNAEKPTIVARVQGGFSQMAHGNWDIMNTAERIQYEKEVGLDTGKDYAKLSQTDVRWVDEVFNSTAPLQNYDISVSGANERFNYFVSGNYYNQEGTAIASHFERTGLRANFDVRAAQWLKLGVNTMFTYEDYAEADEGSYTLVTPISAARFMLPYYSPYKEDGSLASVNDGSWQSFGENPLEWIENNPLSRQKYKFMTLPFVEITPIENLKIRSQFGYDYMHGKTFIQSFPSYKPNNGTGTASRATTNTQRLSITNTATYNFDIDRKHMFNFLVGQEGVDYYYDGFSTSVRGQNNDKLTDLSNGTTARSWADSESSYSYLSFFGRGEYSFSDRFYADASLRADASSRFSKSNRWGVFWSLGFMWNVRNESFMKDLSWLTTAQIAVSTGTSGNSEIPYYDHLGVIGGGLDYVGDAGLAPVRQKNPNLGWENLWTSNLALRLGFINRFNLDIEFYNKKTTNMLMNVPVNSSTNSGVSFVWKNEGSMVNRGVEMAFSGSVIRANGFDWQLSANVSYNKNEITGLYHGVDSYEYGETSTKLVVGHAVGTYYMNRYAGVNPLNGDALWYTKDGEITNVMRTEDRVLLDKTQFAPWQGGFGTAISWKGLSLTAHFSWVKDRWMVNNDRFFDESNGRFTSYNQSRRLLDRWKNPGDITDIPRHGIMTEFDDRLLEDASFLRLKNLTLNWNLPQQWMQKLGVVQSVRLYAQGQNLLTFTKFTGLDPESTSNIYQAQYPMSRQYTFGVDFTF